MKKTFYFLLLLHFIFISGVAQELMPRINDDDVSQLIGKTGVVILNDDSQIVGTVLSVYLSKGQLIDVSIKLQDESRQKFKPTEIKSLRVALSNPTVFSLADSDGNIVRRIYTTQYVFEHPFITEKKVKPQMMQLLNPGYDNIIKIFPNPDGDSDRSISIKSVALSGASADSYILVKGYKIIYVDRAHYEKDFQKIYQDCTEFFSTMKDQEIIFDGLAGHILMYDHLCKN